MNAKQFTSISELAMGYGVDVSHVARLIKLHEIETVPSVTKEGKACKAISDKDVAKLEKAEPSLVSAIFNSEKYITLDDIAADMGLDKSGLHKKIRGAGLEFTYLRVPTERTRTIKREGQKAVTETVTCSGKAKPCLTKAQYAKFKEKNSKLRLE